MNIKTEPTSGPASLLQISPQSSFSKQISNNNSSNALSHPYHYNTNHHQTLSSSGYMPKEHAASQPSHHSIYPNVNQTPPTYDTNHYQPSFAANTNDYRAQPAFQQQQHLNLANSNASGLGGSTSSSSSSSSSSNNNPAAVAAVAAAAHHYLKHHLMNNNPNSGNGGSKKSDYERDELASEADRSDQSHYYSHHAYPHHQHSNPYQQQHHHYQNNFYNKYEEEDTVSAYSTTLAANRTNNNSR
jgi:hypothetical protein